MRAPYFKVFKVLAHLIVISQKHKKKPVLAEILENESQVKARAALVVRGRKLPNPCACVKVEFAPSVPSIINGLAEKQARLAVEGLELSEERPAKFNL